MFEITDVPRREIVDDDHGVAVVDETAYEMTSEETGSAGDKV
jgi:hypothetical protein